jgi:hypothetical protein
MQTAALLLAMLMGCGAMAHAQQEPGANAADGKSIDSLVTAVYEVLSGPAEQKRDWNRFRALFVPGAHLVPVSPQPGGGFAGRVLSVEDYIVRTEPLLAREGFYEQEAGRRSQQWGHIAHVFSTYESRHAKGEKPFMRGINSIQLINDGRRWWVLSVLWDRESPEQPLPESYLKRE